MDKLASFIHFSSIITGFTKIAITGTGQAETYYALLVKIAGDNTADTLLKQFNNLAGASINLDELETMISNTLIEDPLYGPLTLSLIQLWYSGSWQQLPQHWRDSYGIHKLDESRVISPQAYNEGLVWPAMETHPQGAKQPGFGTWQYPPIVVAPS